MLYSLEPVREEEHHGSERNGASAVDRGPHGRAAGAGACYGSHGE
jgi:hypothetical protein